MNKSLTSPLKKLWPYKFEDKSTWYYIDFMWGYKDYQAKRGKYIKHWVINPDFAYHHLNKGKL